MQEHEVDEWIYEYYAMGGASEFELRMIARINEVRVSYGLNALTIDPALMYSTRFHTQTMANLMLDLSSGAGPHGGSIRASTDLFGAQSGRYLGNGQWSGWRGGSGNWGGWSYNAILTTWLNVPGHRNFILNADLNYIGFGSHLGGRHGVFHYLMLARQRSE